MQAFDEAIAALEPIEGGYTNDPADSGGETNYGITVAVARAFGYVDPMDKMPREVAVWIYRKRYWDALSLDPVALLAPDLAKKLFQAGVNCGVEQAGKWFQRCLNVFNDGGTKWPDVTADGRVGPITVDAFRQFMVARGGQGAAVMQRAINALQGAFYIGLAEAQPKDERFVYGWISQRVT